jgi:hypothetical protein
MEALRQIQQLQGTTLTLGLPESFQEQWVEVIVLPLVQKTVGGSDRIKRRPPAELANCEILGDLMASTTNGSDWDALQ